MHQCIIMKYSIPCIYLYLSGVNMDLIMTQVFFFNNLYCSGLGLEVMSFNNCVLI